MVNWARITPTLLDWAGAKGPSSPCRDSRCCHCSTAPGWDRALASHEFHEIDQCSTIPCARCARIRAYVRNLGWQLPYPIAADATESPSWRASRSTRPQGTRGTIDRQAGG